MRSAISTVILTTILVLSCADRKPARTTNTPLSSHSSLNLTSQKLLGAWLNPEPGCLNKNENGRVSQLICKGEGKLTFPGNAALSLASNIVLECTQGPCQLGWVDTGVPSQVLRIPFLPEEFRETARSRSSWYQNPSLGNPAAGSRRVLGILADATLSQALICRDLPEYSREEIQLCRPFSDLPIHAAGLRQVDFAPTALDPGEKISFTCGRLDGAADRFERCNFYLFLEVLNRPLRLSDVTNSLERSRYCNAMPPSSYRLALPEQAEPVPFDENLCIEHLHSL